MKYFYDKYSIKKVEEWVELKPFGSTYVRDSYIERDTSFHCAYIFNKENGFTLTEPILRISSGYNATKIQNVYIITKQDSHEQEMTNIIRWSSAGGGRITFASQVHRAYRQKVDYKDRIIQTNIIAEEGTFPNDGIHTDGYWYIRKELANTAPTISGSDINLGDKNKGFSINYTVDDIDKNDNLTVTEKLNNSILRILNNAPKNQNLYINITNEMIYKLPLNQENTIIIEVNDGNGGITFRSYTFTRTNTEPIISGQDENLEIVDRNITKNYTVHDEEGNTIIVTEKLDDVILKTFTAEDNREYIIAIPEETWILLKNGQHTLTISATDSNNATSIRTYTFKKKENRIILELKKPFSTDAKANKILITPVWQNIDKANVKVEVCNNGHDEVKSWEDATKEVLSNNKYTFKNSNKTSEEWGINIKFTIEKKEDLEDEIYFNGFGGAFE